MDSHGLAWAAGFFDGEGSTYFYEGRASKKRSRNGLGYPARQLTMSVTQWYSPETLFRFQQAVEGGQVNGPYMYGPTKEVERWSWAVRSKADVHRVSWMLWPYLSGPKQDQIERQFAKYHALLND